MTATDGFLSRRLSESEGKIRELSSAVEAVTERFRAAESDVARWRDLAQVYAEARDRAGARASALRSLLDVYREEFVSIVHALGIDPEIAHDPREVGKRVREMFSSGARP